MKFLAMLALIAGVGMADQVVMAACNDGLTAFYPVNQCGRSSWFAPPPSGSGTVSAAWWQIGFGNATISNGGGAAGTGFQFGVGFLGNDSGLDTGDPSLLDMIEATVVGGPAGSLCFSSAANWARPGIDGCADNPRTGNGPFGYSKDDNLLNPYFYSGVPGGYAVGYYTTAYQIDAPMGVLLKESTGKNFALAFFASDNRGGNASDLDPGQFDMLDIVNGDYNPVRLVNNIIPWQPTPNPDISVAFVNPSDTTSDRILTMSWPAVRIVSDDSTRPSTDTTLLTSGVGVNDQGPLVHYAVETAPLDPNVQCGTFGTAMSTDQPTASVTVPANTCVRVSANFGRVRTCGTLSGPNAAIGSCGDIGFGVSGPTILVGGQFSASKVVIDSVDTQGKSVRVSFHTTSELNASTFEVVGVDQRGGRSVLASTNCSACNSGLGGTYTLEIEKSSLKGAKSLVVVMQPSGDESQPFSIKGK